MTDEELRLLERQCDEATSGPWKVDEYDPRNLRVYGRTNVINYPVMSTIVRCVPTTQTDSDGRVWECSGNGIHNAEFIAAARAAVPTLVAEVRRLSEAVMLSERTAFKAGYRQGYKDAERCDDCTPQEAWDYWKSQKEEA